MPNDAPAGVVTPAPEAAGQPAAVVTEPNLTATEPEKTFTQTELNNIVERRLAKERDKRKEVENRARVAEELALKMRDTPKSQPPKGDGEPKREQFDSYETFIEARAEWKAEQKVNAKLAERDQKSQVDTQRREAEQRAESFRTRTKELAKDIADFDEVMAEATGTADTPVSRLLAEPVNECENPAAVLYHLAKNPDEAERIASLSGAKQAREIWALDQKLKAMPIKKPSSAPAPINPVGGKAGAADDEPDANDTKKWIAWRTRQVIKQKKG